MNEPEKFQANVCEICSTELTNPIAIKICSRCEAYITKLKTLTEKRLEIEKYSNNMITGKIISGFKDLQSVKNKMKENINEIRTVEEVTSKASRCKQEFKKSFAEIIKNNEEIDQKHAEIKQLLLVIDEKNEEVQKISRKKASLEEELKKQKNPENFEPVTAKELYLENYELSEKLKSIDSENHSVTAELFEIMTELRKQILIEKNPKKKENAKEIKMQVSDISNVLIANELEETKKKARLIQEEVNVAKRHIEFMKSKLNVLA